MTKNFIPPAGYSQIESKLDGITVFAPQLKVETIPEAMDFKCPQCGASTSFSPSDGMVTCQNCGYMEKPGETIVGRTADEREFTLENLALATRGWGTSRSELHCDSCGADISVSAGDLSSTCPFCASNRVIARTASNEVLRPRYLVPFKLAPQDCQSRFKGWLGKGWMHPTDLGRAVASNPFQGIYLPFWTFDATIQANWRAEVGYEQTERYYDSSSKSWKTRTRIKWRWESGQLTRNPDDWLGVGTTRISQKLITRLYPYDLDSLLAYQPDFLAGWQALNYDILLQDSWEIVKGQMREDVRAGCREQIHSSHVRNFSMLADFENETWRYILLPVYVTAYRYEGEKFQVLVNGQTGKISGQKPVAWWKVWLAIAGIQAPGILLAFIGLVLMIFGGLGLFVLGLAAVLFTVGLVFSIYLFRQATQLDEV